MNRPAIILHRGVRPLPLAHMGRHDPNAAYLRDNVPLHIRQADNLRRTEQATRIARVANDRFEGPPRSYRIEPRIHWPTVLTWWALALSLGCMAYFGVQLCRAVLS